MAFAILTTLCAAASGVLVHIVVFRKGEWDVASPSIFLSYFTVFAAAALASCADMMDISLLAVSRLAVAHVVGLYTSMLVYRAFFHRLSTYPGPFLARLSNFYITALSMKKLHLYEEVQKLHAQFGDYVRLGEFGIVNSAIGYGAYFFLQDPVRSPSRTQKLSKRSTAASRPPPKVPGTPSWNRACPFSWPGTSRSMHVDARSGIRHSLPKVYSISSLTQYLCLLTFPQSTPGV